MNNLKGLIFSAIIIICVWIPTEGNSKTKINGPELGWAFAHPFIAIKAKRISNRVIYIVDSLEANGILKDRSGGQLDAFKHAFWMASLSREIKVKKAYKLGLAHEKYNYRMSKKGKGGGDKAASDMDLWNNNIGLDLGYINKNISEDSLIEIVKDYVKNGEMKIIKKDPAGNSLNKQGQLIDKSTLKTWGNARCLMYSDFIFNS